VVFDKIRSLRKEFTIIIFILICFPFLFLPLIQTAKFESENEIMISLVILGNFLPISILILFLFYESGIMINKKNSFFDFYENGIIHFPKFCVFLSIFESNSIQLVNSKSLNQLIDLDPFSLEVDNESKSLRIYLFSKSKRDQLNRIRQALPLLEAVFPGLSIMTLNNSKKLLLNYSIAEIAGFSLIRENEIYIMPVLDSSKSGQIHLKNKLVLTINSSRKVNTYLEDDHTTQIYTLQKYNRSADFNLIGNIILKNNRNSDSEFFDKNILLRAIIRFQLDNSKLISSQEGISCLQKIITSFQAAIQPKEFDYIIEEEAFPIHEENEPESRTIFLQKEKINPICLELCNIYKNYEIDESNRFKLCEKRIDFCTKLVSNKNFISLLMELAKNDDERRKSQLLNELLIHLSFHQLYCLISQFLSTYEQKDMNVISMQLLHSLINKQAKSSLIKGRIEREIQKSIHNDQTVDYETKMTLKI
jgi:hypothetical protein